MKNTGPYTTNPIVVLTTKEVHVQMAIDGGLYDNVFLLSGLTPYAEQLVNLAELAQATGKGLQVWGEPGPPLPSGSKGLPLFGITSVNLAT